MERITNIAIELFSFEKKSLAIYFSLLVIGTVNYFLDQHQITVIKPVQF